MKEEKDVWKKNNKAVTGKENVRERKDVKIKPEWKYKEEKERMKIERRERKAKRGKIRERKCKKREWEKQCK